MTDKNMTEKPKKKSKEKYIELKVLQDQLEHMQKYIEELDSKQGEFQQAEASIQELQHVKESNAFIPVAQGIFMPAKIQAADELLVNVGANIAVTKKVPQVLKLIQTQLKEVGEIKEKIEENMGQITKRMEAALEELRSSE